MTISDADRKKLRDGAGGECSFRACRIREHLEEAHIVADKPDGPRGDASFTKVQLDAYSNRILLCRNHHAVVDGNSEEWTVAKLQEMKEVHELDVARRLGQTLEPKIVLGEPVEYPTEYADRTHLVPDPQYASSGTMRPPLIRTHKERVKYRLYRVPVTSEGHDATKVYVQLARSTPPLQKGLANPILHLAGDNPDDQVTFDQSKGFSLLNGVPREVDVIAITLSPPYRCFIFSIASDDAMEEHGELDGEYSFQLASFGGGTRDYKVEVDLRRGTLSMVSGRTRDKISDAIARIDPLITEALAILDLCGRPREQMRGADPMHFLHVCVPRINKFAEEAFRVVRSVAPEWIGKLQNVGNVFQNNDDKPAMIQQVEKMLENLGVIQDGLRNRLP